MNRESLKKLAGISDPEELRRAVEGLCMPFGGIRSMTFSRVKDTGSYLCLVSLKAPSLRSAMIQRVGGFALGYSVGLRIPASGTKEVRKKNTR